MSLLKFRERNSMLRDPGCELACSISEMAFLVERRILSSSWNFVSRYLNGGAPWGVRIHVGYSSFKSYEVKSKI